MRARKLAFIGLAAAGVLVVLWLVGGNAYARYRERQVERDWVQSFGTLQNLLLKYPKTTTNETALRLETLVKPLGIDLTQKKATIQDASDVSSLKSQSDELSRGRHAVSEYLRIELREPRAGLSKPSPEVRAFFSAHDREVRALEDSLLALTPPVWNYDAGFFSYRKEREIPDTTAMIALQRVLLARALEESARGDGTAAGKTLEASWKLNQEFRRIPNSLCQIVALGVATWQAGILRKIAVDEVEWRARLVEHDYKRSRLDAELLYHWPSAERSRELNDLEWTSKSNKPKRLWDRFLRPYGSIVWSQVLDGIRKDFVEIRDARFVRDLPEGDLKKYTPSQIILAIYLPNAHSSFRRIDEFLLEAELTDKVLEARQLRQQAGGKWPDAIPGVEATRMPGARWIYSISPAGQMRIVLSEQPFKERGRGSYKLPLEFMSS